MCTVALAYMLTSMGLVVVSPAQALDHGPGALSEVPLIDVMQLMVALGNLEAQPPPDLLWAYMQQVGVLVLVLVLGTVLDAGGHAWCT